MSTRHRHENRPALSCRQETSRSRSAPLCRQCARQRDYDELLLAVYAAGVSVAHWNGHQG